MICKPCEKMIDEDLASTEETATFLSNHAHRRIVKTDNVDNSAHEYKFCLVCKDDRLHLISRYIETTKDLRSYAFICLYCYHMGRE